MAEARRAFASLRGILTTRLETLSEPGSPLFQARHATLLSTEVFGDDVCLCYALGEGEAEGEEAASGE